MCGKPLFWCCRALAQSDRDFRMELTASGKGSAASRTGVRKTGVCRYSLVGSSAKAGGQKPENASVACTSLTRHERTGSDHWLVPATIVAFEGWPALGPYGRRNMIMPSRLTFAQIEDMLARDEARLEAYRYAAAEAAADGLDPHHACGLAKFVEERIDLLRRARAERLGHQRAGSTHPQPGAEYPVSALHP